MALTISTEKYNKNSKTSASAEKARAALF